jgi:hypothetical protein
MYRSSTVEEGEEFGPVEEDLTEEQSTKEEPAKEEPAGYECSSYEEEIGFNLSSGRRPKDLPKTSVPRFPSVIAIVTPLMTTMTLSGDLRIFTVNITKM